MKCKQTTEATAAVSAASSVGGSSIIVIIVIVVACVCLVLWLLWQVVLVEQAQNAHRQTFCFDKLSFNENIKHLPYYQNVQSNDNVIICEYINTEANPNAFTFGQIPFNQQYSLFNAKYQTENFALAKYGSQVIIGIILITKKNHRFFFFVKIVYTKLYDMKTMDFVQWNIKMLVNCIVCCQKWWHNSIVNIVKMLSKRCENNVVLRTTFEEW